MRSYSPPYNKPGITTSTASTSAGPAGIYHRPNIISDLDSASYPANAILQNLDWINVRAYDFYDALSSPGKTAPPAKLHNPRKIKSFESVDTGISEWVSAVSENKLVIGLPFFGYEWLLEDAAKHDFFDPAEGSGNENRDDYTSYQDIKTKSSLNHEFRPDYVTDYCYGGNHWIGYDDTDSIARKIAYFKQTELLGYFA
ncbi:class V chitinase-like [Corylus avellana]|uniref:class V chitinase-like n=1 Tax=Corylus avellana TaxID=13451 RepID=UPI00286A5989|nr:class V chitinase-like [Corylus avellana]